MLSLMLTWIIEIFLCSLYIIYNQYAVMSARTLKLTQNSLINPKELLDRHYLPAVHVCMLKNQLTVEILQVDLLKSQFPSLGYSWFARGQVFVYNFPITLTMYIVIVATCTHKNADLGITKSAANVSNCVRYASYPSWC